MQLAVQLAVRTIVQPNVQQTLPCNGTPSLNKPGPLHGPEAMSLKMFRNDKHHKTAADRLPVLPRWQRTPDDSRQAATLALQLAAPKQPNFFTRRPSLTADAGLAASWNDNPAS